MAYQHTMTAVHFEKDLHKDLWAKFDQGQPIVGDDSPEDIEVFNPLYMAIRKQIPIANKCFTDADAIDPDVPIEIRRQRAAAMKREAAAVIDAAMVEPLAAFEESLIAKERRLVESMNKPVTSEIDGLTKLLIAQEIRRTVGAATPVQQAEAMGQAVARADLPFLKALESGPMRIVNKEILDKYKEEYFKQHVPEMGQLSARNKELMARGRNKVRLVTRALTR